MHKLDIFIYFFRFFYYARMDFLSGKIEKILIWIFLLSLFIGSYRIIGYFVYDIPYGYDPGFFRYAIQVSIDALPSISAPTSPYLPYNEPLYGILTTVLTFIWYSSDTIIWPFLGFLSIFTAFCIYFFAKQSYNRSVWLVAASIFLLSIVQFEEYWWNYWRNILGIIFLIISLGFLLRKSPLAILTIAGLFTIHRPSALYFAVVALLAIIASGIQQKKMPWKQGCILILWWILALPLYLNQLWFLTDMIEPLATTFGGTTKSGTFLQSREFFILIFPYFLILIPAIFRKIEKKEFDMIFIGFLVWLAWSVLRLFFYNRMFVFFDIFVILMAGYSVVYILIHLPKKIGYMVVGSFFLIQWFLYITHSYEYSSRHSISREEFDIVKNLNILIPTDATILSTHRIYTPWLLWYGWLRTLAPWLLENQIWDESKWNTFYYTADDITRCEMIYEYRPLAEKLYIFVWDNQPRLLLPPSCFRPVLSNTSHPIIYEVLWK